MEPTPRTGQYRDRMLALLAKAVLMLAVLLPLSSGLDLVVNPGGIPAVAAARHYAGVSLVALSVLLAALNLLLTRHPFHEYWIAVTIGGIVGMIYVT